MADKKMPPLAPAPKRSVNAITRLGDLASILGPPQPRRGAPPSSAAPTPSAHRSLPARSQGLPPLASVEFTSSPHGNTTSRNTTTLPVPLHTPPRSSSATSSRSHTVGLANSTGTGTLPPLASLNSGIKRKRGVEDESLPSIRDFVHPSTSDEPARYAGDNGGVSGGPLAADAGTSAAPLSISSTSSPGSPQLNDSPDTPRKRSFRDSSPYGFDKIWERARTQKFYVLRRSRGTDASRPEETIDLTGSTGNVYKVCISDVPSCDCPHAEQGNHCKHLVYVLSKVLRAPYELVYQRALLRSELREIFASAPPVELSNDESPDKVKRRQVQGDCPVCFDELDAKQEDSLVWCRGSCGQNIHRDCLDRWMESSRATRQADATTCPLCRGIWVQKDSDAGLSQILSQGRINGEAYMNVGPALGYSGSRDTSSYNYSRRSRNYWYDPSEEDDVEEDEYWDEEYDDVDVQNEYYATTRS